MFGTNQNDKIKIVKASTGIISSEIKVWVDSRNNTIYIIRNHLPENWYIENGDYLERDLLGNNVYFALNKRNEK